MRVIASILLVLLFAGLAQAATLQGTIYNLDFEKVDKVVVEIAGYQQVLSEDGTYSFELQPGTYAITAKKADLYSAEKVVVTGDQIFDLFLFPGFEEEDQILDDLGLISSEEEGYPLWAYLMAIAIFLIAIGRIILVKKRIQRNVREKAELRESIQKEAEKKVPEEKKEPVVDKESVPEVNDSFEDEPKEPAYLDDALTIIKKHEGRITQKELRREMIHLSEAKVSLILTELEHKGKIEKIKKGRGNVIILK